MLFQLCKHLRRHRVSHLLGAQLGVFALLCAGVTVATASAPQALRRAPTAATLRPAAAPGVARLDTPNASQELEAGVIRLQDLSPEAARLWNAANPIAAGQNPPARPFTVAAAGVLDEARAVDCMTAAIYYEAGFEDLEGRRAVAQVVINRLRNPIFPKTVCGVVFQGAERATGCQFTFTCDGSLARQPQDAAWERSRQAAVAALHGYVMKKVGNATHYHADYVAPYWSPALVKVAVVGQHIFYRWTGGMGLPPAFGGRYAGGEMKGLQIATLDNLGHGALRRPLAGAAKPAPPPIEAVTPPEPAPALVTGTTSERLVTSQQVAENAQGMIRADQLDWQGRPRQKGPPRIARPSTGFGL
ncbi:MAG: sleB [Phenylobacterium sp.]|nr:sleB [Phenylobacterium sp.]